ncbi:hypothetical protein [uncultured Draconibacterium sp.]|uniref:hypothetical protein n=1 Tax=uncultured Draconibacterium sp. TaxID=1573823 RepID=UPI0032163F42
MKLILTVVASVFLLVTAQAQNANKDAWLEDLITYKTGLEQKHIDVYNKISPTDFEKELDAIKESLGEKTDLEITIELMCLTRKIGDGHTTISFANQETHNFPFELQKFEGEWRVVKTSTKHLPVLGLELIEIDGNPIDEVAKQIGEVAQFVENEYSQVVRTAQYLTFSELLYGLHIITDKTEALFTFRNTDGNLIREKVQSLNRPEYKTAAFSEIKIGVPEITQPDNPKTEGFWFTPIEETQGLYIHFQNYPTFDEMMRIGEEIAAFIFQNNTKQLVIDMRNNGGGDLYTGLVLAFALNLADPVNWRDGVYVLSNNVTFSAATSNTALYRDLLNATIVGEPTGSNPTGYQDMDSFELPNSKLVICYSKRLFKIQETPSSGVQPDVLIKSDWNNFSQGKDPVLQWVIDDIKAKN